jgi:hypothetical protein
VCALLAATACTPAWRQAYQRGESALAGGRYDDAAVAFSESCEVDAQASDACVRAKTLRKEAVETALSRALGPCAESLGTCLGMLRTARQLAVHDPTLAARVAAALDDASAAHAARCAALSEETYEDLMVKARCFGHHEQTLGTAAHARRVDDGLTALAAIVDPTDAPQEPAWAVVRAGLAQCYGPTPARQQTLASARERFVATHTTTLALTEVKGLPTRVKGALCNSDALARTPVRCTDSAGLQLAVSMRTGDIRYSERQTQKSVRYVDWVEERTNPAYRPLQRRVAQLQDEHRQSQQTVDIAKADCRAAQDILRQASYCHDCEARSQEEQFCGRVRITEESQRRLKDALSDAERELRRTDPTLRIEHYAEFPYTETRHSWEQPIRVEARCHHPALGFTEPQLAADRAVRFEDDSHVGFARAGLRENPRDDPSAAAFVQQAEQTAVAELEGYLDRCLRSLAADPRFCQSSLDCLMRKALYSGQDPLQAGMGDLASAIDQNHPALPRMHCRTTTGSP